jgi:hypothetical protein
MTSILTLGFLLGLRHALDADHLAAVAALTTRGVTLRQSLRLGAAWGLGHGAILLGVGAIVLWVDAAVPARLARLLELGVGVMLMVLGADVLRRLIARRIHFHPHRHGGVVHVHVHAHERAERHDPAYHEHPHPRGMPLRALAVGMVHGMAGSAALLLLTVQTIDSPVLGFTYIAIFGLGSIAGMVACTAVIALPLRFTARQFAGANFGLQLTIGVLTFGLGALLVYETGLGGVLSF